MLLNILKSLLIAIAGVFLLLFPSESLQTVLFYLGIAMVCYGVFTIIAFFISRGKEPAEQSEKSKNQGKIISLVLGILVLVCGVVVLTKTELVIQFFPRLASIFILTVGVACIPKALSTRRENGNWLNLLAIAVATVILGGIILFRPFDELTIVRILGTVMLYLGAGAAVAS